MMKKTASEEERCPERREEQEKRLGPRPRPRRSRSCRICMRPRRSVSSATRRRRKGVTSAPRAAFSSSLPHSSISHRTIRTAGTRHGDQRPTIHSYLRNSRITAKNQVYVPVESRPRITIFLQQHGIKHNLSLHQHVRLMYLRCISVTNILCSFTIYALSVHHITWSHQSWCSDIITWQLPKHTNHHRPLLSPKHPLSKFKYAEIQRINIHFVQ